MGANNKKINMVGAQFGEWTVLEQYAGGKCLCRCSCGKEKIISGRSLRLGESKSCGHTKNKELPKTQFGEWTVLEYAGNGEYTCKCSCGTIKNVKKAHLLSGASTSCGHNTTKFKDLSNQKFGDWEVLEYAGNRMWKCRCSLCGSIKDVEGYSLTSGNSTNCGCKNRSNLIGQRFSELTVIDQRGDWSTCRCSCNNIIKVRNRALINGNTKSCGCKTADFKRETMLKRYGEITASRIDNPRSTEILEILTNEDKFKSVIDELTSIKNRKPTLLDISELLDTNPSNILKKIKQYNLEDKVRIGTYGQEQDHIMNIIEQLGVDVVKNDRKTLDGLELDIYIPSHKLAIEYNGSHWHNSDIKDKNYHQLKTIECAKRGIYLIHIFDYEWLDKNKRNKIIALLKEKIMNNNTRIFARNTVIKTVKLKDEQDFLNNNHLQGYTQSSICYGLYYKDELVALMSFGKPRFNNKYDYELIRLAFKQGVSVIGGAEKLFKQFIKEYNPFSIVSYCDISKFNGNVYDRLGFTADKNSFTTPNYNWVNKDASIALPRYKTMKHLLLKEGLGTPDMTEDEIMKSIGYVKVYDCGNLRFEWYKE